MYEYNFLCRKLWKSCLVFFCNAERINKKIFITLCITITEDMTYMHTLQMTERDTWIGK